jgi:hypothetical protein
MISEHLEKFAGFNVRDFDPATGIQDTVATVYRVAHEPEPAPAQRVSGILGRLFGRQKPPPPPARSGVDLLVRPDFKRHAVLELNAFGDLLPGVLLPLHQARAGSAVPLHCGSVDTYADEILSFEQAAILEEAV